MKNHSDSNRSNSAQRYSRPGANHTGDWFMDIKCHSQDVGDVAAQITNLIANLKRAKNMLEKNDTGVSPDRPLGILGVEKLRNTGKIMIRVVNDKNEQIGQSVQICAPSRIEKFMKDERTGLIVPMSKQEITPWRESLKLATKALEHMLTYVDIGKFIERARLVWDDADKLTPLGNAIQSNLSLLNLEGNGEEDEEAGFLRSYLARLVWPVVNGRPFSGLTEGFDSNPTVGCWIYSQAPVVMERIAAVQTKHLADLEISEAERNKSPAISKAEKKAMVASAQEGSSLKVADVQPEPEPTDALPTNAAPQDAQAS